ncbi:MAG TPA: hypothetical protein VFL47_02590 [Flavisolibacter sp.]|nr:hypothetical protein [Flavisolibacter sp.]
MGLTFWAVLYFRSLKVNSVLDQLTKYLLQYKQVSIPSVGTIQIIQQPAQLNIADKVLLPPTFSAELKEGDTVPEHQLNFLSAVLNESKENVQQSLSETGEWLKRKIDANGFEWKGIGLLHNRQFDPTLSVPALESIPAERVLRQNAEHRVLVGDQHMTSTQMAERSDGDVVVRKRSIFMIIGWILLALAIVYIVIVLFLGKFHVGATGSKMSPTSWMNPEPLQEKPFASMTAHRL